MYDKIFGKYPQVKVINYILINPKREYTKKEIAYGAKISRVTLDSFIDNLEDLKILIKDKTTYKVNLESRLVKTLINTQITLAEIMMNDYLEQTKEQKGRELTDEELDNFMDSIDYEVDIDDELERIEENKNIIIEPPIPGQVTNINKAVFTPETENKVSINSYFNNNDKTRRMINYG
ncbi:hypothetical protein [Candidatus Methanosphaera massiliense]|jgi:hypothetical protein|uniref:hypothetical protein n=1 Tax=Methanosphaera TaxID=2316 RepID=UPI0023806B86|nr:hypothetical protein [Candidatus Methanosphaera massiliense]MDD6285173.1 hypothetical protein [Methanobacteriaceae archaeon]MDE4078446.1 hypothetical protein [Candidatus Methanosphaera massiliense]